jgi:hypothetical protein
LVIELPQRFLQWNYFPRRVLAKKLIEGKHEKDTTKFFLESTRHTPALCTAFQKSDGTIQVNAKIVGVGYVPKEEFLKEAIEEFQGHLKQFDVALARAEKEGAKESVLAECRKNAMRLFLKHLYLEPEEAKLRIDFTKLSTVELALSKPHSSKHTWRILQESQTACLLFYRPPNLSFEVHGWIEIYENGLYHNFVNLMHDVFHYAPPKKRRLRRPVYIFNVEEVYDNSPNPEAFGVRIA